MAGYQSSRQQTIAKSATAKKQSNGVGEEKGRAEKTYAYGGPEKAALIPIGLTSFPCTLCRNARSNDLTRFGTACLLLRHFNTNTETNYPMLYRSPIPWLKVRKRFQQSLSINKNKQKGSHTFKCVVIQAHITRITPSLPGSSHTSLSMNHGQENFPGMKALIRPDRQSQQWKYDQMMWAEKNHTDFNWPNEYYYLDLSWSKVLICFLTHLTAECLCLFVSACVKVKKGRGVKVENQSRMREKDWEESCMLDPCWWKLRICKDAIMQRVIMAWHQIAFL